MGVRMTVPATSANIGIGYDCLGMAMTLHATFDFVRADALRITGCPEEFQNERNLVYRSFALALVAVGVAAAAYLWQVNANLQSSADPNASSALTEKASAQDPFYMLLIGIDRSARYSERSMTMSSM